VQDSPSNPPARIGLFLSNLEGGSSLISLLQNEGYCAHPISDLTALSATAGPWDALILSAPHAPAVQQILAGAPHAKPENHPAPLLLLCATGSAEESPAALPAPHESTVLLSTPLQPHILLHTLRSGLKRRAIEADLRYRLREREDVLRSISEVFFSVDHEFRYTFFNEKAQQVGGKSSEELIGKNMWDVFPLLKNTEFERQMRQVARDRQILVAEYLGPITGGWFEMRIYPSAGGISCLFVNITARKQAEESLKKAQDQLTAANGNLERAVQDRTAQLHHANVQLEELLYSMAHDLRSPLRSMEGYAHAFVEEFSPALDDRAREYARKMTASATFMDRMLNDLLALSRITRTGFDLELVDLTQTWDLALRKHQPEIEAAHATFQTSAHLGHGLANPTLLAQVFDELIANALKFRRTDTPLQVRAWTQPIDDQTIEFNIEDNGIGIHERHRDKVFRVFERLNGSHYEGTGIGLAIARKAAERMKGHLEFCPPSGPGTRFRLTLLRK